MDELAVELRGLTKSYVRFPLTRVPVVRGLNLDVPAGGVHALLGPNGSGKTTTLRMLLGLVRPESGTVRVLGHAVPGALPAVVGRIGAVVEQPRLFPAFSGRRNLELLARAADVPAARVDEVLDEVGLRDRARDPVRRYSLGMKQRAAIAATLLRRPDLVVLDEPTNGLDPQGVHDVRALMRRLADQGRTVLVSSHALGDLEQVADTVSVLAAGRLVAQGRLDDLLASRGAPRLRVRVADPERAALALAGHGWSAHVDGGAVVVTDPPPAADVSRVLAGVGLYPEELTVLRPDLESAYLALTAGSGPAAVRDPAEVGS
ncbi:ABC transporter ATP-binding protein [Cellulomonas alba]|uniref:ABC transporter ATP-binding protein n=1 Tax=Cellulomonas alba TaxID=3053467 RepID=A0ABT7SK38_9CELL|nr:ABC transporter ATP-binding protein [Cellulomonas alba]MDM7856548.1 ABC transporter ATP-binding protein [Cellulomonas alba]